MTGSIIGKGGPILPCYKIVMVVGREEVAEALLWAVANFCERGLGPIVVLNIFCKKNALWQLGHAWMTLLWGVHILCKSRQLFQVHWQQDFWWCIMTDSNAKTKLFRYYNCVKMWCIKCINCCFSRWRCFCKSDFTILCIGRFLTLFVCWESGTPIFCSANGFGTILGSLMLRVLTEPSTHFLQASYCWFYYQESQ